MQELTVISEYKGFNISVDADNKYHLESIYTEYNTVEEVKEAIDQLLADRVNRQQYIQEGWEQFFDKCKGDCLRIKDREYRIFKFTEEAQEHPDLGLTGKEYIQIDNPYGSEYEEIALFRTLFSRRIGDAVRCIREGKGDFIRTSNLLGHRSMAVLYLLDRNLGEKIRKDVVEGFKDAEFVTCLQVHFSDGWGSSYDVGPDDKLINGGWMEWQMPKTFESEKEAHEYSMLIDCKIKELVKKLSDDKVLEAYLKENQDFFLDRDVVHECALQQLRTKEEGNKYSFDITQELKR